MPIDPKTGEQRPPNHELVKWRKGHEYMQRPAHVTLEEQIHDLSEQIGYRLRMQQTYQSTGRQTLADRQAEKVAELQAQLDELHKAARRAARHVKVDQDQEVE